MTDAYAWYKGTLAGQKMPIHDGHPQAGFFRRRTSKTGPWLPAAIWPDKETGELRCRVGGEMRDPQEEWLWLAKNVMPAEVIRAVFRGEPWPDDGAPTIGDNKPPETLPEQIAAAIETAEAWLAGKTTIADQRHADIAANMAAALVKLGNEADAERKREKRPHMDAAEAVDGKWNPSIDAARNNAKRLKDLYGRFLAAEEARRLKEAQAATDAERAREPFAPLKKEPEPPKAQAGGAHGRKAGLKTVKLAVIDDYDAAIMALKGHPEMREMVQVLANRAVRAGVALAGVSVKEERVAS